MRKLIIILTFTSFLLLLGCNENIKHKKTNQLSNSNAYGKNKGDLKGKEFGQDRARQSHLKNEEKKNKFEKERKKGKSNKKDKKKYKNSKNIE